MVEEKADPNLILRSLKAREGRRGSRLRIFFGMSAGVGKTYAMLKAAHKALGAGEKVVIGAIDTHGRPDTEALLKWLPAIPLKIVDYKNIELLELDIDRIIKEKPDIVLIDELAHHNAPNSRHKKRWQDILEILDAGISVWTAVNVQHVESRKDAVEEITGIRIHETIPDSIFDRANDIELVDVTPQTLLERLKEGKIYLGDQAQAAIDNFFREDHITALREIALRYTASKVDRDLQDLIATKTQNASWKAGERLLVAISHSPNSEKLIRTTRRLADNLNADWLAVRIDDGTPLSEDDYKNLSQNLALVQSLGAEVVTVVDPDRASALERLARQRNVTQIVIGRPTKRWLWDRIRGGTLLDNLVQRVGDLDVYVVRQEQSKAKQPSLWQQLHFESSINDYLNVTGWLVFVTLLGYAFEPYVGYRSVGFLFLLLVLLKGLTKSIGPVSFLAVLAAISWDVLFIPPFGTFHIEKAEDIGMGLSFLFSAMVTGILVSRVRKRQRSLENQDLKIRLLLNISKYLVESHNDKDVFKLVEQSVAMFAPGKIAIAKPYNNNHLSPYYADFDWPKLANDWEVAKWVFHTQKKAGKTTETFSSAKGFYIPLTTGATKLGVMGFYSTNDSFISNVHKDFLLAVAHQISTYLERERLLERSKEILLFEESERLHQTVLNSVSHEIRIPLASIIGFSSTLLDKVQTLDKEALVDLCEEIQNAGQRLNHVVSNLLDMTRISQGRMVLHKDWHDINEIVEKVITDLKKFNPEILFVKANNLPDYFLLKIDYSLIETVIHNIVLNAINYHEQNTSIIINLSVSGNKGIVEVRNEGKKIPENEIDKIFDKFYRVIGSPAGGAGLGLAICQSIVSLHQGEIWAKNNSNGVTLGFSLPYEEILTSE
jgi:two-component system, OmpR family, sensor histidine kinase KdpD